VRWILIGLAALLAATSLSVQATAQNICPAERGSLTHLGLHYFTSRKLTAAAPNLPIPTGQDGPVTYMRVLFEPSAVVGGWRVIIRDGKNRAVQVIDAASFASGAKTVWSDRLPTPVVNLTLVLDRDIPQFEVRIPGYDAMPKVPPNRYYSTKGAIPDWTPLYENSDYWPAGDSVGFLTSFSSAGVARAETWCCSGAVIATGPDILFLTNYHCGGKSTWIDKTFCANTVIDMSWDDDPVSAEYVCTDIVKKDEGLDAVVMKIAPLTLRGYPLRPVKIRTRPVAVGESLALIHHPQCLPKQISRRGCNVVSTPFDNWIDASKKTDFTHRCDSEGGSSGAPVFDKDQNFVGLHHQGFLATPTNPGQCDNFNRAVAASSLFDFLKQFPITIAAP
jgi:hypothetical protein